MDVRLERAALFATDAAHSALGRLRVRGWPRDLHPAEHLNMLNTTARRRILSCCSSTLCCMLPWPQIPFLEKRTALRRQRASCYSALFLRCFFVLTTGPFPTVVNGISLPAPEFHHIVF